jgi:SMC interacting uncharacterized protein involved in chromosome segregation
LPLSSKKKEVKMASIEKQKQELEKLENRYNVLRAKIKQLRASIEQKESQAVMATLKELDLTPQDAKAMLKKAKVEAIKTMAAQGKETECQANGPVIENEEGGV